MRTGIVSVLALLAGGSVQAATLRVPSEYPTINAALDASVSGDSVLVAPGTYTEVETRTTPWRDDTGRVVPGGMYFVRLEAGAFVRTRKVAFLGTE